MSRRHVAALVGIAALAAVSYAWGMAHAGLEIYYQAAVRSMASSWHDFFYGALDPAGTISVDKLPGALWVQALSVRLFGFHVWAIVLPQVIEGVVTVLVLFDAVRRIAGSTAGLVAALVLALTPAAVALGRGNVSDSLLILLLVAAADCALIAARAAGGGRALAWIVASGALVGIAFQAKMLQAWLALPAIAVTFLVCGAGRPLRRVLQLAVACAICVGVSLSWMLVVTLVPQHSRPYVDGSAGDSVFEQVFVYNGLGRLDTPAGSPSPAISAAGVGSASAASAIFDTPALSDFRLPGSTGPARLLLDAGGRDDGWFLPAAVASLVALLMVGRRQGRAGLRNPMLAGALLFGSWLLIDFAAFSAIGGINAYYTAALAPPAAGLCGLGVQLLRRNEDRRRSMWLATTAAMATVAYGIWLTTAASPLLAMSVSAAAAILLIGGIWLSTRATAGSASARSREPAASSIGMAALLASAMVLPAAASVSLVASHLGPFDTPYQPPAITYATDVQPARILTAVQPAVELMLRVNHADRYVAATYTAVLAAPLIVDSGREFEPIGGFSGDSPYPGIAAIRREIDQRQLQTVLAPATSDPRLNWISAHCLHVPVSRITAGGPGLPLVAVYLCGPT